MSCCSFSHQSSINLFQSHISTFFKATNQSTKRKNTESDDIQELFPKKQKTGDHHIKISDSLNDRFDSLLENDGSAKSTKNTSEEDKDGKKCLQKVCS